MYDKKTLSKVDEAVLGIIGHKGATYDQITSGIKEIGLSSSCLGGKLHNMVMTGVLTENLDTGVFRRGLLAPLMLKCLKCGKAFKSEGKHNRLCQACKCLADRNCW